MNTFLIEYTNGYSDVVITNADKESFTEQFDIAKTTIEDPTWVGQDSGDNLTDVLIEQLIRQGYEADFEPVTAHYHQ